MKRYIKANNLGKPIVEIEFVFDLCAYIPDIEIAAAKDILGFPIKDKAIKSFLEEDVSEFCGAIIMTLKSAGYYELDHNQSNRQDSNSLYFTFCKETEFNIQQVRVVFRLRVSNHQLPMWKSDKNFKDAITRFTNDIENHVGDSMDLLQENLPEDERVLGQVPVLIQYEDDWYTTYGDVLNAVIRKLSKIKKQYG